MSPTSAPTSRGDGRERVLEALRSSARPLGVGAVRASTGLSANAVRFHLQRLIEAGHVQSAGDPDHAGPGRPAILYAATSRAEADPASAYRLLAALLARAVSRSATTGAAREAGRDWATAIAPRDFRGEPVELVETLFRGSGFSPRRAEPRADVDGQTLELHQCPFLDLAVDQPETVCSVHLGLVPGLLDEIGQPRPVRVVPVLDGSGPCLVHIGPPSAGRPVVSIDLPAVPARPRSSEPSQPEEKSR
ncbi:MAG: helix-turn-helix transcriptional regulator [Ornithinibacter sp.]